MTTEQSRPAESLKLFTHGIIDYAGLFPPASLELAQAFHNFVYYAQAEYSWMLGKFIIPARRLNELAVLAADMEIAQFIPLSVIGTGGSTAPEFETAFNNDLSMINDFLQVHGDIFSVDAYETRLPADVFEKETNSELAELMKLVSGGLEQTLAKTTPVFFEAPVPEDHEPVIIRAVESIASINKGCGFKLRTGGTEPNAFPAPEVIAFAIMTCCEFGVPMKCTAGLHHPVRHYNEEVLAEMHGFLNVFAAGILAYTENLDEAELVEVLTDDDPFGFEFGEEGLIYNDMNVSNEDIRRSREEFMLSYGSCSFDEPIEDLKTLELF